MIRRTTPVPPTSGAIVMSNDKLRRKILYGAARLVISQQETQIGQARILAARKICKGWVKPCDLPSEQEIRDELQRIEGFRQPPSDDRFELFYSLMQPLALVSQRKQDHPEGDVLYHSLQVFDLARDELSYDEEFQLAALLHDVGKGVDPVNPIVAGLHLLGDSITSRTSWLIEHLPEAHRICEGTIGVRARRRLHDSEDFAELVLLAECDRAGRVAGVQVPELEEALAAIKDLSDQNG
jgi:hypothetical protein